MIRADLAPSIVAALSYVRTASSVVRTSCTPSATFALMNAARKQHNSRTSLIHDGRQPPVYGCLAALVSSHSRTELVMLTYLGQGRERTLKYHHHQLPGRGGCHEANCGSDVAYECMTGADDIFLNSQSTAPALQRVTDPRSKQRI